MLSLKKKVLQFHAKCKKKNSLLFLTWKKYVDALMDVTKDKDLWIISSHLK